MKRMIYIPLVALGLSACGDPSIEEELASANDRNEELQSILQTEEVALQKNTQRLEALEEDISKMQSVISNPDIDAYVDIVTDYSKAMKKGLSDLDALLSDNADTEDLSTMDQEFEEISESLTGAIEDYRDGSSNVELDEYLERQHSAIQLANEDILGSLDTIGNGISMSDQNLLDQGLEQLRNAHEYY
ncbi:hypothetical protein ACFOLA_01260 [Salinicoccus hispanicus]|uniref:Uncharacterized protein n=1 Tax=Salinicoccus hispanicus TaxID=157225 RepID=A0A6N8TWC9_9STAP|nr:hypothetical protein [Salinicoccus hispanicus]MXQ50214.1 hypothetical protein [Salinicoccus hispanicus]